MGKEVKGILEKYGRKIEREIGEEGMGEPWKEGVSMEYGVFRKEVLEKKITRYERWCFFASNILKVKPSEKDREKLLESIEIAHLEITPEDAVSFGALVGILMILFGIFIGALSFAFGSLWLFIPLLFVVGGALVIKPLGNFPNYLATRWRLEASNQMVLCILYVVM